MRIIKQDLHTEVYFAGEWCISWCKNNIRHREDGPAVIWYNKVICYYLESSERSSIDYWEEIHANY